MTPLLRSSEVNVLPRLPSLGFGRYPRTNDHGAITAEFAVALPAVVLLLSFLLAGGAAGITQLRLEEAVRAGARASARGDSSAAVEGTVHRLAGGGASPVITNDAGWVTVRASARVGGALGAIIPWTLTAAASARAESGIP